MNAGFYRLPGIAADPQSVQARCLATFWPLPRLMLALPQCFHIRVCAKTVRHLLQQVAPAVGRAKAAHASDN